MIRALPILIIFMVIMIGTKLLEILDIAPNFMAAKVIQAAETDENSGDKANNEPKKEAELAKEKESKPEAESKKEGEASKDAEKEKPASESPLKNEETAKLNDLPTFKPSRDKCAFSLTEASILQELAARRDQLDQREKEILTKENSLIVIENNINKKIIKIQEIQEQLKYVLAQYEIKEDEKIKSLVKVYESMKPVEAAKIFEKLEMPMLLAVSSTMKEAKLAMILAKMDPSAAKDLTAELINYRKVRAID
ncbi:MAG: FlaA locus kDa protein [Rickettsiaceae bacterium]|jgi:flagellar motility protein MotE (MotC chaperone)|nr:FlaA locus kDa protein [Rickettsiaceae bacterium]